MFQTNVHELSFSCIVTNPGLVLCAAPGTLPLKNNIEQMDRGNKRAAKEK